MNGFWEIGQNDRFGNKMPIFDPLSSQNEENENFSRGIFFTFSFKIEQLVSMEKISKILWTDFEKLVEMTVLGENGHFGAVMGQNGENEIFPGKKVFRIFV